MKYLIILFLSLSFGQSFAWDIQISTQNVFFSPNHDGFLDTMVFHIESKQTEPVADWKFTIKDESGKLIKEYNADLRKKRHPSFWNFLKTSSKIIEKPIYLPKDIQWTGVGANGKIPPDGRYIYQMTAKLLDGKEIKSKEIYLYLDSNPPISKVAADVQTFSPNGDKNWDNIIIRQEIIGESSDRWKGTFWDKNNLPIKTYIWEHTKVPKALNWDGKDDRGIPQEEGAYRYEIVGEDFSKNITSTSIYDLQLNLGTHSVDAFSLTETFFPNGNNMDETISFRLNSSEKKILSWKFGIYSSNGKIEKEWTGFDSMPLQLDWDGMNQSGKPSIDGEYYFYLEAEFVGGKKAQSKKGKVTLNRKPIELQFMAFPNDFTPDRDGSSDVLEIKPNTKNLNLRTWKLSLVEKYGTENSPKRKIVKKWKGFGALPDKILWEGITDSGVIIGSLADLELYFSFRNEKNEHKTFLVKKFYTGISVMPTNEKGVFKISIPEYIWKDRENEILSKVKDTLSLYPGYKVEVLSHSKQLGDNKANLRKTEQRAKYIFEKLFGQVATNNRFSYRGFGEVEPLFVEENEYRQEKNDRVDFILSIPKEIP